MRMIQCNTSILNQLAHGKAELKAYSRLLKNEKVTPEDIIDSATTRCGELVKDKHVLVLNDTTQLNYESHSNFLDRQDAHLGPIGNDKDLGFFLHPGLVVDADQGIGLGFSYIKIWNRRYDKDDKHQRDYQKQSIEEKESYRWIECGLASKQNLQSARHLTIIADRESDIYSEFVMLPDERTGLVIRSSQNRKLYDSDKKLYETLSASPCRSAYSLTIRASKNGKRQARDTQIEIRYTKVKIQRPKESTDKSLPDYAELYAIEAKENPIYVPDEEKPICWRLLTTYAINDPKEAYQIIKWYALRWQIELLFNTLKSSGLNIEISELETGKGLKNLCLLAMQVALKINQLTQGRDRDDLSAEIIFSKKEIVVLKALKPEYEGKTERQKNHFKEESLAWSAWIIARMGGWKSDVLNSKPGNKTMKRGLDQFKSIYKGWYLYKAKKTDGG